MSKQVRVAIVGVGNCANSFVQGLTYYGKQDLGDTEVPTIGLVRPKVGPYAVEDVKVVAAFDVAATKVGKALNAAIWAAPNATYHFASSWEVPSFVVQRGPTLDGLGKYLHDFVPESDLEPVNVAEALTDAEVDVVINYLPVGSQAATEYYAEAALKAGCAFVNCIPVFLASDPTWAMRFAREGLPIIGDDIKSQVGATITHRVLAQLFRDRGVHLDRTYQLNVGGNGDFKNMLERERLNSKKLSKTEAVVSVSGPGILDEHNTHIGPSDYIEWLGDRKIAYIRLEGTGFGGAPMDMEIRLSVWDSPNSAGIVIDAVRCAKLAMDRDEQGPIELPSACFMKRPPTQMDDDEAYDLFQTWLEDCDAVELA